MQAMSQKAINAISSGTYRSMVLVRACSAGPTPTTPAGWWTNISVTGGTIKEDRTSADARRTIDMTTNDPSLVPLNDYDPLNIYGNHLYTYRGVLWSPENIDQKLFTYQGFLPQDLLTPANGAYELVPTGVFRISDVIITEDTDGDLQIEVKGSDMSATIASNTWTGPVTVYNKPYIVPIAKTDTTKETVYVASTIQQAIRLLVTDRWPASPAIFGQPTFDFGGVSDAPIDTPIIIGAHGVSTSGSSGPWTDISALAAACNAELYFGPDGAVLLRNVPDPNVIPPVWSFVDGDGGLLNGVTRTITSSTTLNYVIATGENPGTQASMSSLGLAEADAIAAQAGTPVDTNLNLGLVTVTLKAVAFDNDPTSPTYYLGPFGRKVGYEPGRKLLITQQHVQDAAETYLNWYVGGDEQLTIHGMVNPAQECGDVIRVRRRRNGIFDSSKVVAVLSADLVQTSSMVTYYNEYGAAATTSTLEAPTAPIAINQIKVFALESPIAKGTNLQLYGTDLRATSNFTLSQAANIGDTVLYVNEFTPKTDFRAQDIILNPSIKTDGSVNYFCDQITLPLTNTDDMTIVCRERRVGTKKDAIRIGEYSQSDSGDNGSLGSPA